MVWKHTSSILSTNGVGGTATQQLENLIRIWSQLLVDHPFDGDELRDIREHFRHVLTDSQRAAVKAFARGLMRED